MRRVSSETLGWLLWGTMIGLGVAGVVAAGLALSGRWRRWVFFRRMLLSVVPFTTFPLVSGFMGLGLAFLALGFVAGPGGIPGETELYDLLGAVFLGLGLVSFVWWPRQWMPAWHRDWMRRGGDDLTDPWQAEPGRG